VTPARFLIDTSALVRLLRDPTVRAAWEEQVNAGLVAVCPVGELEFLQTAKSTADREELVRLLADAFSWVSMPEQVFSRAMEVQAELTTRGQHRSAGTVDLLLAAAGEYQGLTLVHYDHDFDVVAAVTGQPAIWIVPAGSVS
jgi:predicted nucleic acid-binding protein